MVPSVSHCEVSGSAVLMDSKLSGQARQLPRGEVSAATQRVVSCMYRDCALPVTSICCLHSLLERRRAGECSASGER